MGSSRRRITLRRLRGLMTAASYNLRFRLRFGFVNRGTALRALHSANRLRFFMRRGKCPRTASSSERPSVFRARAADAGACLREDSPGSGSICAVPEERGAWVAIHASARLSGLSRGEKSRDCDRSSGCDSGVAMRADGLTRSHPIDRDRLLQCPTGQRWLRGSWGDDGARSLYFASDSPGRIIGS